MTKETEPRKPTDSATPQKGTKPKDSAKPKESVKPQESVKPKDSAKPKPKDSAKPQESVKPKDSAKPQESVRPESVKPKESVKPDQSVKAGGAEPREAPDTPDETVKPKAAEKPAEDSVAPTDAQASRRAWYRLSRAGRPRLTKANVLATLLALSLGFAIAAQVRQTSIAGLEDLREDELIRVLDKVDQDGNRLATEIQSLQLSRDSLKSDTTSLTEAQQAAQQRLDSLAIMAGTVPAKGPGILLTIRDPQHGVTAPLLLDTLQELRDAGAEAVEINNVRVVANTYFTDDEGGIAISGTPVTAPYVITAIGEGSTLASAMEIPGGVTETVRTAKGEAIVETKDEVTVSALQTVSEPQYARPVPSPSPS